VTAGPATATIDFHTHGIPRELPRLAERHTGDWPGLLATGPCTADLRLGDRFFRSLDDRCWDPARRIEDMDAEGVALQVVSPIPVTFSYRLDAAGVEELARVQNEWLAGLVRERPSRFAALGTLPLQAPDRAAAMVPGLRGDLGLHGVEIGSNVDGRPLDDPALEPVFAACADNDVVVFVHPWQVLGEERLSAHGLYYSVGMPAETAAAAATLVLGGVLDRHPRLRVVLAHGGGAFLALLPRIDRCTAMLPGLTPPAQDPSAYATRFWYDSLVYDPGTLRGLVEQVGADRVLVGTDYPFPIAERPAGAGAHAAGLSAGDTGAVLHGTAAALLGLGAQGRARSGS
jgi:aminocarboxymuconate-semialdehyde decarboxylase